MLLLITIEIRSKSAQYHLQLVEKRIAANPQNGFNIRNFTTLNLTLLSIA